MPKAKQQIEQPSAETPAERYKRIKDENLESVIASPPTGPTHEITTPTGMVWKVRRPDIAALVEAGALPLSFAQKMLSKAAPAGDGDGEEVADSEKLKLIQFQSRIVRYCAVSPQIVENPDDSGNQIGFDDVTAADYKAISDWAVGGGDEAARLGTFPR